MPKFPAKWKLWGKKPVLETSSQCGKIPHHSVAFQKWISITPVSVRTKDLEDLTEAEAVQSGGWVLGHLVALSPSHGLRTPWFQISPCGRAAPKSQALRAHA